MKFFVTFKYSSSYENENENKIDVDFVANKVYRIVKMKFSDGSGWTTRTVFQCKKQKY